MTADEINTIGNTLIGMIQKFGVREKTVIAGKAGMEIGPVPASQQNMFVDSSIRSEFAKMDEKKKLSILPILAEQILANSSTAENEELVQLLGHHGYQYIDGTFVPVGLLDERESQYLPTTSASDLSKAISRLADGDESAAITSACGAVDLATSTAYDKYNLGGLPNSFQARVNTVMSRLQIFEEIEQELVGLQIKPADAAAISKEMRETIKHAANALEVIRRTQSDAHGTKPAYRRIAYDVVKWASSICGLLEGKV